MPLNTAAKAVLAKLYEQRTGELVFTQATGEGYKSMREAFYGARDCAGVLDVTPHVCRRTFASRLVMAGVDLRTVQEVGVGKLFR